MEIVTTVSTILSNLGSSILVALAMCVLGLCFRAGVGTSIRGGLYAGIGLAGLTVIINNATNTLTPAITAFSERLGLSATITDVGWGSSGIAFAWPGLVFTLVAILVVNAIMVVAGLVKTMWTDIWSLWHGQVLGGFVWALTGNVTIGVVAAVIYLVIGSFVADYTAKTYQDFNGMPGISVPCTVSFLGIFARPFNYLLEKIPGIRDINASPEAIRKRIGIVGELGVMGTIIGVVIGILAGYDYAAFLNLGIQIGVLMVFLPKTVSVLCDGVIPIANAVVEFVQERFGEKKEIYVAVDCAALLGHPSVMSSAVILYPLAVLLAVLLPGNGLIPIASLAVIPYWCGAVAPYLKGNVFRIVLFMLVWMIPVMLLATANADLHTLTMGSLGLADPNVINSSFDMGGDPLGFLFIKIAGLFA